ncbi:MAG: hypothetical protein J6T15_05240 [Bacilli bacterium]|nr:hypothetical protein [Bacilli bacterium]
MEGVVKDIKTITLEDLYNIYEKYKKYALIKILLSDCEVSFYDEERD